MNEWCSSRVSSGVARRDQIVATIVHQHRQPVDGPDALQDHRCHRVVDAGRAPVVQPGLPDAVLPVGGVARDPHDPVALGGQHLQEVGLSADRQPLERRAGPGVWRVDDPSIGGELEQLVQGGHGADVVHQSIVVVCVPHVESLADDVCNGPATSLQGRCRWLLALSQRRGTPAPLCRKEAHMSTRTIDSATLQRLVEQAVGDFGSVLNAALVVVGDRLGLYRALAEGGPITSAQLASRTGTTERNVREWLSAQAATGFVTYHAADAGRTDDTWSLSPEQEEAFTNDSSPAFLCGGFQVVTAAAKADERVTEAFRHGSGVGWHEHHHDLFDGTERFFRPGYAASLVSTWLPALDGVIERLERGATVADVGCGHGASTVLMAQAFPASRFIGYDYHASSIDAARRAAVDAGVADRIRFEVAPASGFAADEPFDLVCYFDCLHDMGDPVGALAHTRQSLAAGGTVMVVEPMAGDSVGQNLSPVGRLFYAVSTLVCTPASQAQAVGLALGAQAGLARLTAVAHEAGFSDVTRVAESPFNQVLRLRA